LSIAAASESRWNVSWRPFCELALVAGVRTFVVRQWCLEIR